MAGTLAGHTASSTCTPGPGRKARTGRASNSSLAGIFTVFARTNDTPGGKGVSAFVVERGTPGMGIGRPQVWGLAAFGQPGVEAVIDILNRELLQIMRQAGTPALAAITRESVIASTWR